MLLQIQYSRKVSYICVLGAGGEFGDFFHYIFGGKPVPVPQLWMKNIAQNSQGCSFSNSCATNLEVKKKKKKYMLPHELYYIEFYFF